VRPATSVQPDQASENPAVDARKTIVAKSVIFGAMFTAEQLKELNDRSYALRGFL
jgi:hypothetical protein